jgi:hypothetical protein
LTSNSSRTPNAMARKQPANHANGMKRCRSTDDAEMSVMESRYSLGPTVIIANLHMLSGRRIADMSGRGAA